MCAGGLTQTRFVLKARPSAQTLVLKLTDDRVVGFFLRAAHPQTLKYRAKSAIILNRLDEFQRTLAEAMSGVAPAAPKAAEAAPAAAPAPAQDTTKAPGKSKNKKKGKKK